MAINNAKQTRLEKTGFERRDFLETRSDYNKNDGYNEKHETALSDVNREFKPQLGKGTGHNGHQHSIPNPDAQGIDYSNFDTKNGGGKYDIEGRNGVGGRIRNFTINIYNEDKEYGLHLINTDANVEDGQYKMKD